MKWSHTAPPPGAPSKPGPARATEESGDAHAHPPIDQREAPHNAAADGAHGVCKTKLRPDDLRARLLELVDTRFLSRLTNLIGFSFCTKSYVGHIGRRRFRIETRNGFGSHGGALVLYGSVNPLDDGAIVRWRFGLHPFLRLVAGIWFFAAAFAGVVNLWRALFTHGVTWGFRAGHLIMGLVGPGLMVLAGQIFIRYCLYSERDKKRVLTEMMTGVCGQV